TRNVITGNASPSNALGQSAARNVEKGSMSPQPSAITTQDVPARRGTKPSNTNRCVQSPEAGAPPLVSPVVSGLRTPRSAFRKTSPTPPSGSPEKKKNRPRDGADQVAKSHCAMGSKGRARIADRMGRSTSQFRKQFLRTMRADVHVSTDRRPSRGVR